MPLQLERRRQFVDALVEDFHHPVVATIQRDLADPDCALAVDLHGRVRCNDPGPAQPSKTFPHPFKNSRAIIAPLILIITADETGYSFPVSAINCVKEIFGVQPNLMLGSPEPDQI